MFIQIQIRVLVFMLTAMFFGIPAALAYADHGEEVESMGGQDGPAEVSVLRIAILDARVTGDIDPERLSGITSVLVAEASKHDRIDARSAADVRDLLGFEADRQVLGYQDDNGGMIAIADAMGVDYLLSSEVTLIGDIFGVTLNLLDPATGRATARATRRVTRESDLVYAADVALAEILVAVGIADEGLIATREAAYRRTSALTWGLGGAGAAAGVGGGALLLSAWQTYWAAEDDAARGDGSQTVSMREIDSARKVRAPLGVGLMVGGAAMVASAFILPRYLGMDRPPEPTVAPTEDGAVVSLTFSLW